MPVKAEVERLKEDFRQGRARLLAAADARSPGEDQLRSYADLNDRIVREIFSLSTRYAEGRSGSAALAIVATGGYGRRELSPFSDVDIAFIPGEEEDPWLESVVHVAFKLVMDVFLSLRELRVGYSYRPVAEVSTWDLATRTAMLDARFICGEPRLSDQLSAEIRRHLSPLDLVLEHRALGERPAGSPSGSLYQVEPDLKNGPGALRDMHRARWIYKLWLDTDNGRLYDTLQSLGLFSARRIDEVRKAAEWFWRARNWLHLASGKRSDILITNYQDRAAAELGGVSTQEWLLQHFTHAETLDRFREAAIRHVLGGPLEIQRCRLLGGYLHLYPSDQAGRPGQEAGLFQLSQHYGIPVALDTLQALEDSREMALRVTEPSPGEIWAFLGILREGRRVAETLRAMARAGLIDRFVEGFSRTMRFVPPDPAHRYTIGEHSLRIVECLEDLLHRRDPAALRFSDLIGQCRHFDMLCLAALVHDAGKLAPVDDHCEASRQIAERIAAILSLAPEKRELLERLVLHHVLLVRTARLQDLNSPNVIQDVARKIGSVEVLRHLVVFTYADTRAVTENNWTSMDERELEALQRRVQDFLGREGQPSLPASAVAERLGSIRKRLARFKDPEEEAVLAHCALMPASYVLNTSLDEIAMHVRLLRRLPDEEVVLDFYNRPNDSYTELTVCTYDDPQPGMLARIAGVLYGCGVDIHKAQVFTLRSDRPVVLDTLWVAATGFPISEGRARRLGAALREVLSGATAVEAFLERVGRKPASGIPLDRVELRNDLSEEHTVVHVIARDREGLLYLMTRTLSSCQLTIHTARVATWNARAENNFYVTMESGAQIPETELPLWKERLTRALRGQERG